MRERSTAVDVRSRVALAPRGTHVPRRTRDPQGTRGSLPGSRRRRAAWVTNRRTINESGKGAGSEPERDSEYTAHWSLL